MLKQYKSKKYYRLKSFGGVLVLVFLVTFNSYSDDRSNGRSNAMAFATLVSSIGTDAYGINPANYDYYIPVKLKKDPGSSKINISKPRWEFSIFSIGGGYGSDSSIDFYNNYLSYLTIDRNKFVNLFTDLAAVLDFRSTVLPNKKTEVNYDFELRWLSAILSSPKIGAVNFTVTDRVGLNTNVNSRDEYLPLTFGVNYDPVTQKTDLTNVHLEQSEAIAWWIRKYSLGYAKKLNFGGGSFSFGFDASLVHGFGNVSTYLTKLDISTYGIKNNNGVSHVDTIKGKQDFHTQSALTDYFRDYKDGHESKFNLFPKPAGMGYGLDFGVTLQLGKKWKFAASAIDIGKITWNYNTITNNDTNYFAYYDFDLTGSNYTYNRMVDDLGGYNTQDSGTEFTTDMPTRFRAGIMFMPSDKLLIEFNWYKGINNMPGNSDKSVFAIGVEYFPVPFLPVRAGISAGAKDFGDALSFLHPVRAATDSWDNKDYFISLGAGLIFKNFTLDFGTHGLNQLFVNRRFSIAFSSKLMF